MKVYIAVGGIGCSILQRFQEKEQLPREQCYYMDTAGSVCTDLCHSAVNPFNIFQIGAGSEYISQLSGGYRNIGKAVTKYDILSNRMGDFFQAVQKMYDVELVFVTSSFGGTGSGAVFEIAEYLQALLWAPHHNRCTNCLIVAFNYHCFDGLSVSLRPLKDLFELNTVQMVMEASTKSNLRVDITTRNQINDSIFNPFCEMVLIDEPVYENSELYRVLQWDPSTLDSYDNKNRYAITKQKSAVPEVFISYSGKDQAIADLVVDALEKNGVHSWIASKNIVEGSYAKQIIQGINGAKIFVVLLSNNAIRSQHVKNEIDRAFARLDDGLMMIPFIIEECELDDECRYYLCRQEMFDGSQPPMLQRINDVVSRITSLLE